MIERSVREDIASVLAEPDWEQKLERAERLCERAARVSLSSASEHEHGPLSRVPPARPAGWRVLDPLQLPERPRLTTPAGRYALLHSVANIELSAVELALLTVADLDGFPLEFYHDWLRVAGEEVQHARMVAARLRELGGAFGDEPVHLALWSTASAYADPIERLGVVPRILEARGLDVSARLRTQLRSAGDPGSAEVLERIYRDEIGHVAVGSLWFGYACRARSLDPEERFVDLWRTFAATRRGRPTALDLAGRRAAGFSERELEALGAFSDGR